MEKIIQKSSSFVVRLQDNTSCKIIKEHVLTESDQKAGVEFDHTVSLGPIQKRNAISKNH